MILLYRDERLKKVAPGTVRLELALISHLFTILLKEWNIPVSDPLSCIRKPSPSNARSRRLEDDEEKRLLLACKQSRNPLLYSLVALAIETGMRLGELLKLEWQDANLIKQLLFLTDTKNGSNRTIPLSNKAIGILINIPKTIGNPRISGLGF